MNASADNITAMDSDSSTLQNVLHAQALRNTNKILARESERKKSLCYDVNNIQVNLKETGVSIWMEPTE
jgi:hypothetical protein